MVLPEGTVDTTIIIQSEKVKDIPVESNLDGIPSKAKLENLRYKYYNVIAIYMQNQIYHEIQDIEIYLISKLKHQIYDNKVPKN